jgi:putative ABC transport system permease protein
VIASRIGLAARLAWREARGGLGTLRLLFVCLLLGVFALAGVGSVASAIRAGIADEGRVILGGDIEVRLTQRAPTAAERAFLARFGTVSYGVRTRAMISRTDGAAGPLLGELKMVDGNWPLYGAARLAGGGTNAALRAALDGGVVASQALAEQLGLKAGDSIRVGEAVFPVTAILAEEPDRAGEGFALGPTLLVGQERLGQSGVIQPGSLWRSHLRLRLAPGVELDAARSAIEGQAEQSGWKVTDRDNAAPGLRRFIDRLAGFLLLVSLSALVIAGIGVGNGVSSFLDSKARSIATLKVLGASSRFIAAVYMLLIATVSLAGALAGAALGSARPLAVAHLLGDMLPVSPAGGLHWGAIGPAMGFGMLVALGFAVVPLARAAALPALRLLRGAAEPWPWPSRRALAAAALLGAGVIALVVAGSPDPAFSLGFLGGALGLVLLLAGAGIGTVRLFAALPASRHPLVRMAFANLARSRGVTIELVVALGLGLSLLGALAFLESGFRNALGATVPQRAPAFFVLDLPRADADRFRALVPPGSGLRMVPSLRGPITAIRGVPVDRLQLPEAAWIIQGDRGLTWSRELPDGNRIVSGAWWPPDYRGPPLVSMDAEQAALLGLGVGDSIGVSVLGVELTARIASLRQVDWDSLGVNFALVFDPASLADAPYSWMATVTPPPQAEPGFIARVNRSFPSVSIIRVKDVVARIDAVLGQMAVAVRAAAGVAVAAGIAVLAGALAAGARARTRDAVLLKLLGATRLQLMASAALEYGLLAAVMAAAGLVLGAGTAFAALRLGLGLDWAPDWGRAMATVGAGAVLTLLLGAAGSVRALSARIGPVLRAE